MPHAISSQGYRIHYREYGSDGPVVVLVMGIGVSGNFWGPVPSMLRAAPYGPMRVLVVDNRGTGQSDDIDSPVSIRDMADDIPAVLDHAGADRAVVMGISLGGMIAQHVAIRHPSRVRALGLLCTTPGLPLGVPPSPLALKRLVSGFGSNMRGEDFLQLMYPASQVELAISRLRTPEYGAHFRNEKPNGKTFAFHFLAAAAHTTRSRELRSIRCPTLVLTGRDDVLIPPSNSRRLARRIPGAELRVLPDVGHDMMTLAADEICRATADLTRASGA